MTHSAKQSSSLSVLSDAISVVVDNISYTTVSKPLAYAHGVGDSKSAKPIVIFITDI